MKKFKRKSILIGFIIFISCAFEIISFINDRFIPSNLGNHEMYYAQHMPHKENYDPEMVMLMNNIILLSDDKNFKVIDDVFENKYGIERLINGESGENHSIYRDAALNGDGYEYTYYPANSDRSYIFDKNFELIRVYSSEKAKLYKPDKAEKESISKEVHEIFLSTIKTEAPIINLQSLFNKEHADFYK